jgi:hypothetical protein
MAFGADGLGSMRSRRARFFPEDQIQLIGIEARVLTILPISNRNGNAGCSEVKKRLVSLLSHPIADAAREVGISISGVSKIWPARTQRP